VPSRVPIGAPVGMQIEWSSRAPLATAPDPPPSGGHGSGTQPRGSRSGGLL